MPGVKINLDEWSVDVDAEVCLHDGLLELILCVDNTKEHESIFSTKARALHIHTALLLMGSKPGTPAMKKFKLKGTSMGLGGTFRRRYRSVSCFAIKGRIS